MKDFNLSDPIVARKLKERYGTKIPMNEPVISPEEIYRSDLLATVMGKWALTSNNRLKLTAHLEEILSTRSLSLSVRRTQTVLQKVIPQ